MKLILLIALAGAFGAVSRYALSGWTYRYLGELFPYGTLVVNILGCFLLGAIGQIGETTDLISQEARIVIAIGFLGAMTTFSTFSYETLRLLQSGSVSAAFGNITAQLLLGLLAVWAGIILTRVVFGGA